MPKSDGDRIKVMQVTHDLGIGGLPRVVETLCLNLDRTRFDLEVLCLWGGGPLEQRLAEQGIPSHILERPPVRLRADYFATFRIADYIRTRSPTIVHTHNTEPFLEAGFAAKRSKVPILIHTDHARDFPDTRRNMIAERVMSRFTDYVVAVSDHGKDNLRRYIKVPEEKLVTVLNGVDRVLPSEGFDRAAALAEYGVPPGSLVVGLGARFTEQKGIEYMIRGVPSVLERHPNTYFVIAGYGPLEEMLKAEAEALGVSDHVRFIGAVDSMSDVLACFDIFALPSIWEGLPMAILEAMSSGVPIVATDVGGVGGALRDGHSAILVPSADPAAFADGLATALASPETRERLAANARDEFDRKFSAAAMAQSYTELYEKALVGA